MELQLQPQSFQRIFSVDFFRTGWFDLLAVQLILKSLLQHHGSKESVLQCSAFFIVSAVQQNESAIHINISCPFWTFFPFKETSVIRGSGEGPNSVLHMAD